MYKSGYAALHIYPRRVHNIKEPRSPPKSKYSTSQGPKKMNLNWLLFMANALAATTPAPTTPPSTDSGWSSVENALYVYTIYDQSHDTNQTDIP